MLYVQKPLHIFVHFAYMLYNTYFFSLDASTLVLYIVSSACSSFVHMLYLHFAPVYVLFSVNVYWFRPVEI